MAGHLNGRMQQYFEDYMEYALTEPMLFGDYRNALMEEEGRYYEDVLDYEAVQALFQEVSMQIVFL